MCLGEKAPWQVTGWHATSLAGTRSRLWRTFLPWSSWSTTGSSVTQGETWWHSQHQTPSPGERWATLPRDHFHWKLEVERALRATVLVPSHFNTVAPHPGPAPCSSQNVVKPPPHDAAIQRMPPGQCSQPRSTGASPQVLRREEKPPQLSAKAVRGQVRYLDISVERLQELRQEAKENANEAHKLEITEKMEELHLLRRRVAFLDNEMERAAWGNQNNPTTVGHLQRIGRIRAYVLFPNVGQTVVYSLTSADLAMLDLCNRANALSCEPFLYVCILPYIGPKLNNFPVSRSDCISRNIDPKSTLFCFSGYYTMISMLFYLVCSFSDFQVPRVSW